MRHIIPISGKDSCATAILQTTREPSLPYELFFTDVGLELPETYAWLDLVEKKLGLGVHRIGKPLRDIIMREGILPSPNTRFCTRLGKIIPMEQFIGSDEATVYFGIRADEDRVGYQTERPNIHPRYPLKELGVILSDVYLVLDKIELRPPTFFWERLHRTVMNRLDEEYRGGFDIPPNPKELVSVLPRWVFDSLFCYRSRSNCFLCFFQSKWEWVGLLEHHPDLFAEAKQIENAVQVIKNDREKAFTWIEDFPLSRIQEEQDAIFNRRVASVIKTFKSRKMTTDPEDALSVTSCGLFCGK